MEGVWLVCTGGLQTFFIHLQRVYRSGEDSDTNCKGFLSTAVYLLQPVVSKRHLQAEQANQQDDSIRRPVICWARGLDHGPSELVPPSSWQTLPSASPTPSCFSPGAPGGYLEDNLIHSCLVSTGSREAWKEKQRGFWWGATLSSGVAVPSSVWACVWLMCVFLCNVLMICVLLRRIKCLRWSWEWIAVEQ